MKGKSNVLESITVYSQEKVENPSCKPQKLKYVLDTIKKSNDKLNSSITKIRATKDLNERQKLKKELLPYFTFNKYKNNYRNNENFESAEFLILDFDHIDDKQLIEVKDLLKKNPDVFSVFISPGGDGLKIILRLESPVGGEDNYRKVFEFYASKFEKEYNIEVGKEFDPARVCYLSLDPHLYVNTNATPVSLNIPSDFSPQKKSKKKKKLYQSAPQGAKAGGETGRTPHLTSLIGKYIQSGFDENHTLEIAKLVNKQNNPPLTDDKVEDTVKDLYERYRKEETSVKFIIKNNSYYKKTGGTEKQITSFIILPKTLIYLDDSDCLICDVQSFRGKTYTDIILTNTDWHTKQKFLKALGKQDCTFTGSDNDLQALCQFIQTQEFKEKKGTKIIGLIDGTWVVKDFNITKDEILSEPVIIPYEKGTDAFLNRISYKTLTDAEFQTTFSAFYDHILKVNKPNKILAYLGWIFATPVKPLIKEYSGSFPLLFNHGGFGSGKTSYAENLFGRLVGYVDPKPNSCTLSSFAMLKLLGSTNAIPLWFDELKLSDMAPTETDNIFRYMRRVYTGEILTKGQQDQTVIEYHLLAPMAVMGEWAINQPALLERVILIRSQNIIKKDAEMQRSFNIIKGLELEGFMPRYIQFLLNQDIETLYKDSAEFVSHILSEFSVAPRIKNNLTVMVLGIELFRMFAHKNKFIVPEVDYESLLKEQLKEITGSNTGVIKSGVDQMLEFLSSLAANNFLQSEQDYKFVQANSDSKTSPVLLAINFNKIYPNFKIYAQRVKYEGDLLNKEAYLKMFEETPYIVDKARVIKFSGTARRAVILDVQKIEEAGILIDGFDGYNGLQ